MVMRSRASPALAAVVVGVLAVVGVVLTASPCLAYVQRETLSESFDAGFWTSEGAPVSTHSATFAFSSGSVTADVRCAVNEWSVVNDVSTCNAFTVGGGEGIGPDDCASTPCSEVVGTAFLAWSNTTGGDWYGVVLDAPVHGVQVDIYDNEQDTSGVRCYTNADFTGTMYDAPYACAPDGRCGDGDYHRVSVTSDDPFANDIRSCLFYGADSGSGLDNLALTLVTDASMVESLVEDFDTGFYTSEHAAIATDTVVFSFSGGRTVNADMRCAVTEANIKSGTTDTCFGFTPGGAQALAPDDCSTGPCSQVVGAAFLAYETTATGDWYGVVFDSPVHAVGADIYDNEANDSGVICYTAADFTGTSYDAPYDCNRNGRCEDGDFHRTHVTSSNTIANDILACVFYGPDAGSGIDNLRVSLLAEGDDLECGDGLTNGVYHYSPTTSAGGCDSNDANNCEYDSLSLQTAHPTTLRLEAGGAPYSRLEAQGSSDFIYIAFDLPSKYFDHELVFADAAANECEHADWELVSHTAPGTQTLDNGCYTTFEYRLLWSDAYANDGSKCGWERDATGANVELVLDFGVRANERLDDMRNGTTITREVLFSHPLEVQFPTQVVAQTTDVQVFSPVRTLAAVVGQSVTVDESTNPDTATMTVTLSTEVQDPFELHAITSNTVAPGITLVTTLNGANDENVRQEAECTNGALDCANTWQIQYSTQTTTTPCNFNGGYSVDFAIRCSDASDTNCPIDDATDSVTVSFTLASSDHCPTVIDSIVLSAELKVYDAPQRVTDADDFVGDGLQDDGQTPVNEGDADQWQVAYFTAPTTSSQVAILETEFNQVWVERGAAADVTLLDKENSLGGGAVTCTATAYADADDTASCGTEAGLDSTTCQLVVPDVAFPDKCGAFDFAHRKGTSAAAGENSIPWFEFDINTGASGFNLANDAIETMTVHAVIDVSYANAAKRVAGSVQETRSQPTSVAAPLTAGTATSSSSTSTSSSALFGMNATVLYGAGAFLVLAVLAVAVVVSRRRGGEAKMTKIQSSAEMTTAV